MAIASLGIWLVAGAAAAFNCLVEKTIDAKMKRTAWRPTAKGELSDRQALIFSAVLCAAGSALLYEAVNPLTMWLTFATFVGYAVIYTVVLKPLTPQNIVIGGASGAMPPVLGWAAMTNMVAPEALILFLIIFLWTPPHFWALSLYTSEDYEKAGVPMMPVTAGAASTRLQILIYSLLFVPLCIVPAFTGLGGISYLVVAALGGLVFLLLAWRVFRSQAGDKVGERNDDGLYDVKATSRDARNLFAFSILYLTLLFATLLAERLFNLPGFGGLT